MWPQQQGCGNPPLALRCARRKRPLQCGRSSKAAEIPACLFQHHRDCFCFNVAAAARLRKWPTFCLVRQSSLTASMWPQQQGCGNPGVGYCYMDRSYGLQCGRSSKAAEIVVRRHGLESARPASMWPQQQGCGNDGRERRDLSTHRASMWPQQQGCGNPAPRHRPRRRWACFNVAAAARLRKSG